ncbi:MAG: hypothetical protein IKY53_06750, partial [Lachnospiraceae bacterium]|nr:hypothetical protein [Lachnospiraceae bacterium]
KLSKGNAVFKCDEELCAEVMTRDVISQCTNSSFNNQYMKQLLDKYGDKFSGIALYHDGELCGYICGLRPESEEIQYRIKKCEFL